ncbi:MAG: Arm DNA-binding domain-containing protein [Desulfovibrio sp.]|jgi:hypothetical protein|nr:Arm DNA-binding domain-containing protein [Desulfovibrio sp.]
MPLTDALLRGLKPNGIPSKYTDSDGLYLYISASGGKLWRMDYRFNDKRKTLSLGAYPAVPLKDARRRRDDARELLADGIDPGAKKKEDREAAAEERERTLTFSVVAEEWLTTRQSGYDRERNTKFPG